jgi:hypothetical protein
MIWQSLNGRRISRQMGSSPFFLGFFVLIFFVSELFASGPLNPGRLGEAVASPVEGSSAGSTTPVAIVIPQPFRVIYKADYKGLPISATGIREFSVTAEAEQTIYTLTSSALSIFAKLTEQSDFTVTAGTAQPLFYRYDRTGLGKNKSLRLNFNWPKHQVTNLDSGKTWDLPDQTLSDRLLYQFQLQTDLINLGPKIAVGHQLKYQIQDKDQIKDYHFTVKRRVQLQTPLGPVATFEIIRSNAERRATTLWLAPDYEFMLIRFEQRSNDGENFSLAIEKAFINDQPLLGFEAEPNT